MNKKVLIGIIAAAGIILLGAWAYMMSQPGTDNNTVDTPAPATPTPAETSEAPTPTETATEPTTAATIAFTDSGFTPSTTTVKKGAVITVTNDSTVNVQFSSADHPSHETRPELNMKMLRPGESGTVTITEVGTWGFHDHLDATKTGKIVVVE